MKKNTTNTTATANNNTRAITVEDVKRATVATPATPSAEHIKLETMSINDCNFAINAVNSARIATVRGGIASLVVARNYRVYELASIKLAASIKSMEDAISKLEDADDTPENAAQLVLNRAKLEKLNRDAEKVAEAMKRGAAVYSAVVDAIYAAGNTRYNAERILTICALDGNMHLADVAFDWDIRGDLMTTLATVTTGVKVNADGVPVISANIRASYKSGMNHLRLIIKNAFSLKSESDYFKRVMTTPDAEDMRALVVTFIRDFKPVRKDGAVEYDYDASDWRMIRTRIVKIVLKHMMAA